MSVIYADPLTPHGHTSLRHFESRCFCVHIGIGEKLRTPKDSGTELQPQGPTGRVWVDRISHSTPARGPQAWSWERPACPKPHLVFRVVTGRRRRMSFRFTQQ